jgi:hypothetical protein
VYRHPVLIAKDSVPSGSMRSADTVPLPVFVVKAERPFSVMTSQHAAVSVVGTAAEMTSSEPWCVTWSNTRISLPPAVFEAIVWATAMPIGDA